MSKRWWTSHWLWTLVAILLLALIATGLIALAGGDPRSANGWQRLTSPGDLSAAHAHLIDNCAACHTSVRGVDSNKCITCHASNDSLLQRQPTAFHADVNDCRECHLEQQGHDRVPVGMDHAALARIGLRRLDEHPDPLSEHRLTSERLRSWLATGGAEGAGATGGGGGDGGDGVGHPGLSPQEALLNCAQCHKNQDRHMSLFGQDCSACHETKMWTIPQFRHPAASSTDCVQCHQAPPSHYMMHFKMVSQSVAGQPHARVDQCYICHQTTSWPDIRRVGWYKHH